MNLEYSIDETLYKKMLNDMQLIFCSNSNSSLQVNLYTSFAVIGVTGLALFAFSLDYDIKTADEFFVGALLFAAAFPLSWFMNRQFVRSYNRALINEYKGSFGKEVSLDITESGVSYNCEGIASSVLWSAVSNIYAGNDFIIIFSDVLSVSVPYESISTTGNNTINDLLLEIERVSGKEVVKVGVANLQG